MTKKRVLIILLLFSLGGVGNYMFAQGLTLSSCIDSALINNNKLQKAKLDVDIYNYSKKEALSAGLPQISATGNLKYNIDNMTMVLPGEIMGKPGETLAVQSGTKYNSDANLSVSQLLYSGSYFVGVKAAKVACELSEQLVQKTEEDVIYNVSVTYYNLLQLNQQMKALQSNLTMINKLLEISKLQYDNDIIKKVELDRITVTKTNLETNVDNLSAAIVQLNNVLKYHMGISTKEPFQINFNDTIDIPDNLLALDFNLNHSNRSDIQILNTQQKILALKLKGAKTAYQPSLSAYGQFSYQAMRNEFNFFDGSKDWYKMSFVGLKLNVPIFTGFNTRSKVQKAKIALRQSEINLNDVNNWVDVEFMNAKNKLANSLKSVKAQDKNRKLAMDVYSQTQLAYQEGTTSLISLLDAETALRQAKTGYNNEVLNFKIAELDLLKAKGDLKSLLNNK